MPNIRFGVIKLVFHRTLLEEFWFCYTMIWRIFWCLFCAKTARKSRTESMTIFPWNGDVSKIKILRPSSIYYTFEIFLLGLSKSQENLFIWLPFFNNFFDSWVLTDDRLALLWFFCLERLRDYEMEHCVYWWRENKVEPLLKLRVVKAVKLSRGWKNPV